MSICLAGILKQVVVDPNLLKNEVIFKTMPLMEPFVLFKVASRVAAF